MAPMKIRIDCPKCGSYYQSRSFKLEADDTLTCGCGFNIPLDESQRAEINRAFEEDVQEFREATINAVCEEK